MGKLVIVSSLLAITAAWSADWLTDGGNVQRTAWQKDEKIFSVSSVKRHQAALEDQAGQ